MTITLKDLVIFANTGADAIQKAPIVKYDTGIKCVRVGDFSNNRPYSLWRFCKVDKSVYKNYKLLKDDLLITRTASLGLCKIIKKDLDAVYNNGIIRLKCDCSQILPLFLYYQMKSTNFLNYISGIEGGSSTRPNMKINYLLNYKFKLPDKDQQQHIVNILGTIDDKIENNEKKIEGLEEFLMDKFAIFFKNLTDYEKKKAEDVFDITIGRTPPRQECQWFNSAKTEENKKWISISDMGNTNAYIFSTNEYLTNDAIKKFNIPIIKENTVILSFKLTIGRVNITTEEMLSNEAIAHFNTKNKVLLPYTYCYLKKYNFNDLGSTSSIATATNSKSIRNMDFILPNEKDLENFYKLGNPILSSIFNFQKLNLKLTELKQLYIKKFFN